MRQRELTIGPDDTAGSFYYGKVFDAGVDATLECVELVLAAKARAVLHGRTAASLEDVKALARPILRHRVVTNFHAESEGVTAVKVVDELVAALKT